MVSYTVYPIRRWVFSPKPPFYGGFFGLNVAKYTAFFDVTHLHILGRSKPYLNDLGDILLHSYNTFYILGSRVPYYIIPNFWNHPNNTMEDNDSSSLHKEHSYTIYIFYKFFFSILLASILYGDFLFGDFPFYKFQLLKSPIKGNK
jgi:hypothetical protein